MPQRSDLYGKQQCRRALALAVASASLIFSAAYGGAVAARSEDSALPVRVPDSLGVNIHFTKPQAGELEMLKAAGFRWVRMDFGWESIEREKGKYDFTAYDGLLAALRRQKIKPLFILDYGNPLYDEGRSPATEEARKAFCVWVAAAVTRYRGRGILWEMWNEPNIGFWKPKPDVDAYAALARAVGKTIREVAPGEQYIGPATSTMDFGFLESCFKAGLLDYWSAVTVHPYRQVDPETVAEDYATLRTLIARYAPPGKTIPILSGEWGYSAAWGGYDEMRQARYLAREMLINLACGIPVSIWYDWHNDGANPKEPEENFGTVAYPYRTTPDGPAYTPKPAYLALRTLSQELAGYAFDRRMDTGSSDTYVFLFKKGRRHRIVAWTRSALPQSEILPIPGGRAVTVTRFTGDPARTSVAIPGGTAISLTGEPVYISW